MSACDEIQVELSAYLDGEVPSGERASLDAHLQGCPACRAILEELRGVKGQLADLPKLPAAASIRSAVRREIEKRPEPVALRPHAGSVRWGRVLAGMAALLVLSVFAYKLSPYGDNRAPADRAKVALQTPDRSATPKSESAPAEDLKKAGTYAKSAGGKFTYEGSESDKAIAGNKPANNALHSFKEDAEKSQRPAADDQLAAGETKPAQAPELRRQSLDASKTAKAAPPAPVEFDRDNTKLADRPAGRTRKEAPGDLAEESRHAPLPEKRKDAARPEAEARAVTDNLEETKARAIHRGAQAEGGLAAPKPSSQSVAERRVSERTEIANSAPSAAAPAPVAAPQSPPATRAVGEALANETESVKQEAANGSRFKLAEKRLEALQKNILVLHTNDPEGLVRKLRETAQANGAEWGHKEAEVPAVRETAKKLPDTIAVAPERAYNVYAANGQENAVAEKLGAAATVNRGRVSYAAKDKAVAIEKPNEKEAGAAGGLGPQPAREQAAAQLEDRDAIRPDGAKGAIESKLAKEVTVRVEVLPEIEFSAAQTTSEGDRTLLSGAARLRYKNDTLEADRIEYFEKAREVNAFGNVKLNAVAKSDEARASASAKSDDRKVSAQSYRFAQSAQSARYRLGKDGFEFQPQPPAAQAVPPAPSKAPQR